MSQRKKKSIPRGATQAKQTAWPLPGRAADHPFCAYMGAQGETCAETAGLETVFVLKGPPRLVLLACLAHREAVHQMVTDFVLRSQISPQTVAFQYRGKAYHVWITGQPEKPVC